MNSLRRGPSDVPSAPPPRQPLLSRLSELSRGLFWRQGYLLATNQIAALLFASLLICSLLYPGLSLYFSPDGPTNAIIRRGRGEMVWELEGLKRQGVIWNEDEVCWDRLVQYYEARGIGRRARVVRMEQVLVSAGQVRRSGTGALSKRTLHQTLQAQKELERRLLGGEVAGLTCVRDGDRCMSSSPANWWSTEADLLADDDVHRTLSLPGPRIGNDSKLPLTTTNTLVGVGRDRRGTVKGAHFLTMTFYLEDTSSDLVLQGRGTITEESARDRAKVAWRDAVRDVMGGRGWEQEMDQMGTAREGRGQGRRVILKHLPHLLVHSNPRLLEDVLFGIGYVVVGIYVFWTMNQMHQVYSKVGLMFTGLVELIASGIMSLSVCWLLGINMSLVPWKLIPFLVLVCGVDNMFVLIDAIFGTDIGLPVAERVAVGLASVGLSTTVTLACELLIVDMFLRIIDVQVIRQLITFTAVALVVDYCLEMSFFVTILSIDIQRLELADLLRQGSITANLKSPDQDESKQLAIEKPIGIFPSLWISTKQVLRARAARTATFAFLIFINLLLYSMYGPDHYLPAFCSETALAKDRPLLGPSLAGEFASSLSRGQRGDHGREQNIQKGDAAAFWKLINPANVSSVHVYVEPVMVVKFHDDELVAPESVGGGQIVVIPIWLRVGTVVTPIAATIVVLYFILSYLIKDAELLETERVREQQAKRDRKQGIVEDAGVLLSTLRGRHAADVELIASGNNAVISWAGLDDHVVLWEKASRGAFVASRLEIPITADRPSLTLLTLDSHSKFCAASTRAGRILVWNLDRKMLIDFSGSSSSPIESCMGQATHLFPSPIPVQGSSAPPKSAGPQQHGFYSIHQNGTVVLWDCTACTSTVILSPPLDSPDVKIKTIVVHPPRPAYSTLWPLIARVSSNGLLQLHRTAGGEEWSEWSEVFSASVTTASDPIAVISVGAFDLGGDGPRSIVVVSTLSGLVTIYAMDDGSKICTLAQMDGAVRQIRLSKAGSSKCSTCTELITNGFVATLSTRQIVSVLRVFTPSQSFPCSACNAPARGSVDLSRSPSVGSRHTPKRGRRISHVSSIGNDESPYPAPLHGFHHRRGSGSAGGDSPRRQASALETSIDGSPLPPSPSIPRMATPRLLDLEVDGTSTGTTTPTSEAVPLDLDVPASPTDDAPVQAWPDLRILEVAVTSTDERGGWEIIGTTVVGVRRRKATAQEKDDRMALDGRRPTSWDVWTIPTDPGSGNAVKEGMSSLEGLLARSHSLELVVPAAPLMNSNPTMRRRNIPTPEPAPRSFPSIRFEDVDLPFSRARPVVPALVDGALAIGLGNSIALVSLKNGGSKGMLELRDLKGSGLLRKVS